MKREAKVGNFGGGGGGGGGSRKILRIGIGIGNSIYIYRECAMMLTRCFSPSVDSS